MEEKNTLEIVTEIQRFLKPFKKEIITKYKNIKDVIEIDLDGYPELATLKSEIERCIVWNCNQAAITLTNHFLEKLLKYLLINNNLEEVVEDLPFVEKIARSSEKARNKCDNMKMAATINAAYSQKLISKKDKRWLHIVRNDYRNAYGHASQDKIHKDVGTEMQGVSFNEDGKFILEKVSFTKISEIPVVQGLAQAIQAEQVAAEYFRDSINLSKRSLEKLYKKSQKKR